jgi:hypothetical protein
VEFRQTEPGKYQAKFKAEEAGSYYLSVKSAGPDGKTSLLSSGLDVSYPPEYRDLESNRELLENIASVTDGRVVSLDEAAKTDFFQRERSPAFRLQDAWPMLLLVALCLFLCDVAVRRIAVEPAEVSAFVARQIRLLRRKKVVEASPTLERLKSIKASVDDQLKQRRFEVDLSAPPPESVTAAATPSGPPKPAAPKPAAPTLAPEAEKADDTPFSRLLKAKQDALKKRKENE